AGAGARHGRAGGGARRRRVRARAAVAGRRRPRPAAGGEQPRPAQLRGLARHHPGAGGAHPAGPAPGDRERRGHARRRGPAARRGRGRVPGRRGLHARRRPRRRAARDVLAVSGAPATPAARYGAPRGDAPLVVFDFDHTLYDGDSGSHLFAWLIRRHWWRWLLALLLAPVFGPMVAFLPTRRVGISGFVWAGTVGLHRVRELDALIDAYVAGHADAIRARLLPVALDAFHAHRARGDRVVV